MTFILVNEEEPRQRRFNGHDLKRILVVDGFEETQTYLNIGDDLRTDDGDLLVWPSGVQEIDERCRGFGGLVCLAADPKVGKSQQALRSAVMAAQCGWRVVYVGAENDYTEEWKRIQRIHNNDDHRVWWPKLLKSFSYISCEGGRQVSADHLSIAISKCIQDDDRRLLIVIDSINRLADMYEGQRGEDGRRVTYFDALRHFSEWARRCRRLAFGRIGFLIVSETNFRGGVKGAGLSYMSDQILTVRRELGKSYMDLYLTSRLAWSGKLGTYIQNWRECRWERIEVEGQ